jgi:hypothetical protein
MNMGWMNTDVPAVVVEVYISVESKVETRKYIAGGSCGKARGDEHDDAMPGEPTLRSGKENLLSKKSRGSRDQRSVAKRQAKRRRDEEFENSGAARHQASRYHRARFERLFEVLREFRVF